MVVRVPQVQQSTQAVPAQQLRPGPEAFGASILGAGMQEVGKAANQTSEAFAQHALKMAAERNKAEADNAENTFTVAANEIQTRVNNAQGFHAQAAYEQGLKDLEDLRFKIAGGMTTDDSRSLFQSAALNASNFFTGQMAGHAATEYRAAVNASAKASLDNRIALAVKAYGSPEYEELHNQVLDQVMYINDELQGGDASTFETQYRNANTAIVAGVIEQQIAARNYTGAQETLRSNYNSISSAEAAKLQRQVDAAIAPQLAKEIAETAVAGGEIAQSATDRRLLALTLRGEAGDQPLEGRRAVLEVIRNRARMSGMSIGEVVEAPHQFEAMNNPKTRARLNALSDAELAAEYALIDDMNAAPVLGPNAVNFINPEMQVQMGRAIPAWAQREGRRVGAHVFFEGTYSAPKGYVPRRSVYTPDANVRAADLQAKIPEVLAAAEATARADPRFGGDETFVQNAVSNAYTLQNRKIAQANALESANQQTVYAALNDAEAKGTPVTSLADLHARYPTTVKATQGLDQTQLTGLNNTFEQNSQPSLARMTEPQFQRYQQLKGMSASPDPGTLNRFMNTPLLSERLPRWAQRELSEAQSKLLRGESAHAQLLPAMRVAMTQLRSAGVVGQDIEPDLREQFEGSLLSALQLFTIKNGKVPTDEEVRQITTNLLIATPQKTEDGRLRMYETQHPVGVVVGVPDDQALAIVSALRRSGVHGVITSEEIRQRYQRSRAGGR